MAVAREPIYVQINQTLRDAIRSEYREGDRFLSEREVCQRFGVSRMTAHKVLSSLVTQGLLESRNGVGTFVRSRPLDYDLRSLVSFTEKAQAAGKRPGTKVLRFETMPAFSAPAKVRQALGLQEAAECYYLERLRLADRQPVILERRYVAARLCPDLRKTDLAGSLYALWTQRYRLNISGAEQTIHAVGISAADARLLGVRPRSPGLLVEAIGYVDKDQPLWYETTLYNADAYEFRTRLGGIRSPMGRFVLRTGT